MNTVIHASSSQVITPAMRNTIRNAVGAKLGNIVTPDATVHVNVKNCFAQKTYYKITLVLESVKYTLQVKSSKDDFYVALDDAVDKLKHSIHKTNKKKVTKKRREPKPAYVESLVKAAVLDEKYKDDDFVSINGISYCGEDDFCRRE